MDEITLRALELSIEHWKENAEATEPCLSQVAGSSCALCKRFNSEDSRERGLARCNGCPVSAAMGQTLCDDTPYDDAHDAHSRWAYLYESCGQTHDETREAGTRFRECAKREVEFLRSLLPQEDA